VRNVVFVAPFPLETTLRFVRATVALPGVRVLGIVQSPPHASQGVQWADMAQVADALDAKQLVRAVEILQQRHGRVDRVIGVLEALQVQLAQVREHFGIEGQDVASAERFRDKSVMKETLRAAGIPCARHRMLRAPDDAAAFVREVGFPIVIKPPAGVGCRSTYRIDDEGGLAEALAELRPSTQRPLLAEEFLRGEESTFETITLAGEPVFHSISRYLPGPLDCMRNDWIQYCVHLPRDIRVPRYDDVRRVGVATVKALGMRNGMTHMEWFRRPDGTLAVGEIAMRPPGVNIVPMMGHAYGADMFRAWARAVVDHAWDGPWNRSASVGCAFLRGPGRGRVARVEGLEALQRSIGGLVVESRLPREGQPKADGYEGEGWIIVRHPSDEVVQRALATIIETVRVRYA
jgi:biotin carboxylase